MRTIKRLFAIVFCVALMGCATLSLTACTKEEYAGGFYYQIQDDGTAAVYVEKYDMTELVIPDSIGGLRVTTVKKPKKKDKINLILTNIVFPETVRYIDDYAFEGCVGLEELKFPDGLLSIGNSSFEACSSLTVLRFPKGFQRCDDEAFYNCSGLKEVYFPDTLTYMSNNVFSGCPDLEIWCALDGEPTGFWNGWGYDWSGSAKKHWNYDGYNN